MIFRNLLTLLLTVWLAPCLAQSFNSADASRIGLFPQQNDLRNTLNLSGMWQFKKDSLAVGEKENWQNGLTETRSIAVPGSWNEQFTDSRDYLGMVWYEKETYVPSTWKGQRVFMRIGSATYAAKLWVNGKAIGKHEGGNLPFVFEISSLINWGATNRVSIQLENILKPTRVPTGNVTGGPFSNFPKSNYDFFPFAGLHRDVWLYSIPNIASIRDITVKTDFTGTTGRVELTIVTEGKATQGNVVISGNGQTYETSIHFTGNSAIATITIPTVRLWSPEDPYLYTVTAGHV